VASAGLSMDGDPRAAYSVLTWAGGGWRVAQYRVEYDVQRVAKEMRRCGLPRGCWRPGTTIAASPWPQPAHSVTKAQRGWRAGCVATACRAERSYQPRRFLRFSPIALAARMA